MTVTEFISNEYVQIYFACFVFMATSFFFMSQIWNSPDDPRGQQLTLDQIFNRDKN